MFQSADPTSKTQVTRNSNDRKIRSEPEKEEKRPGTEMNRTRLLAQKLLEASRGNRDFLKDRCNNPRNVSGKESSSKDVKGSCKVMPQENPRILGRSWSREEPSLEEQPRPPARRRRDSRHRGWKDADGGADERTSRSDNRGVRCPLDCGEDSNGGAGADENSKARSNLERPDILDGLLKESDRQLANLRSDLGERGRSRSHWRGFVQSMRLHDVELHSDGEDQRKGEFAGGFFSPSQAGRCDSIRVAEDGRSVSRRE